MRLGAQQNGSTSRYCANLGHVQDDESGLIYMRARFYQPQHGRFVKEDPAKDGANWTSYCSGNPVGRIDPDGQSWWAEELAKFAAMLAVGNRSPMSPADVKAAMEIIDEIIDAINKDVSRALDLAKTMMRNRKAVSGEDAMMQAELATAQTGVAVWTKAHKVDALTMKHQFRLLLELMDI